MKPLWDAQLLNLLYRQSIPLQSLTFIDLDLQFCNLYVFHQIIVSSLFQTHFFLQKQNLKILIYGLMQLPLFVAERHLDY